MTVPETNAASGGKLALGIISIVLAVCFWPVGLILSIITVATAPRGTTPKILGYVALGISALFGIIFLILLATGHVHFWARSTSTNP
jgi:hypothetical protein